MPYPFELPTTSSISFDDFYISATHPSLPLAATTCRGVLRDVLKKHKRLPPPSQTSDLPAVATALNEYIPHLSALDAGLSNSSGQPAAAAIPPSSTEAINVVPLPRGELAVEWRATLTASPIPGRDPPRVKLHGLRLELGFALASLAYVHSLQARAALHALYNYNTAAPPSSEQRTAAVAAAMRSFLEANSIHSYLVQRLGSSSSGRNATTNPSPSPAARPSMPQRAASSNSGDASPSTNSRKQSSQAQQPPATTIPPPDLTPGVQTALAELTLAEATLIAVLKDDPYPAVVAEDRSRASRDWMFKAPDIPRVRAHLFARLCLAAAEHAARGKAALGWVAAGTGGKVDEALGRYLEDLRRTARGKACRFFGIDAELEGKTGEAIAWLRAARRELGFGGSGGGGGGGGGSSGGGGEEESGGKGKKGFASRLKKDWSEKREDRKIEKGADWGSDAGRFDEGRVVDMLEKKWVKMNDTVGVQTIPPIDPLLASMPSGREYHSPRLYKLPHLDESTVTRMRAPPPQHVRDAAGGVDADDSSSGDDDAAAAAAAVVGGDPVGAFPGTSADYAAGGDDGDRGYY